MLIDYHVHLEEGPYSFNWLERTAKALGHFQPNEVQEYGSKEKIEYQVNQLQKRLNGGCYGEEWLDLYLKKAKQIGMKEVGIVDHLYRFKETKNYFEKALNLDPSDSIGVLQSYWIKNVMTEKMDEFVEAIVAAKKRWEKEGVSLKLGIEADYFVGQEEELEALLEGKPWDYVIGSIHYMDGWGFDNPQTASHFEEYDLEELYTRFYETVEKMIRSNMFDFVAHLDNLKVFNFKVNNESFNQRWYERIAVALKETNTATEVNAGLYYRYPAKDMCPSIDFLTTIVNEGIPITLSSDSHYPDDLGKYVAENKKMLQQLGASHLATFHQRERNLVQIR
ncbi:MULTISPECIES: histidinol phosphate phosphatase domain-containing protein [unclassified Peribacillus]|uniref:histidinol phosphate phosphatase domain-containing protein n=1 Tax=unclassified Peribacillus TaxID=2675266 RepID=UPI0019127F79|nr:MULTISPECIES: histidinol phosphate phosphatase domain-containing protein [unclassified Peribacillus]MBK5442187.1 histidinol phosphate phosphatase domain-containing protein [Peribacillus sp. TH24]MBK5463038.1 histidinol phosphate phosphatase domain-containing protein [Peribacillus sp. TH27]